LQGLTNWLWKDTEACLTILWLLSGVHPTIATGAEMLLQFWSLMKIWVDRSRSLTLLLKEKRGVPIKNPPPDYFL
jgi:hypothetical protein